MTDPDPARDAGLPDDDYLVQARRADLALARRELAACRRPVPYYDGRDVGPTEAWRLYLAETDPEWAADALELPAPRPSEVAA